MAKHRYFEDEFIGMIFSHIPCSKITQIISETKVGETGFTRILPIPLKVTSDSGGL
jgi:hypothetical protein